MSNYPLLFFSKKDEISRTKLHNGPNQLHLPTHTRQDVRLSSKFTDLSKQLAKKELQIQESVEGIIPEETIVLETIGSVEDFITAVKKIDGLEWITETEIDDISPDEDFFDNGNDQKLLNGRLYLISTNSTAMNQLFSLWQQYVRDPEIKFERGLSKFKDIFKILKNIRKWDVEDRFDETNLLESWKESITIAPKQLYRFEIELWYKNSPEKRAESYANVKNIILDNNGRIITSSDIPEIKYHSILAELPANQIENIVNNVDARLIKCENIMYFRPSGQIIMDNFADESETETYKIEDSQTTFPSGQPKIAIFDGFPLQNHSVLKNRLIIDDPDNFESHYQVEERKHGTAMCSLIIKGDLEVNDSYITSPLYVRPIMRPETYSRNEFVPDNILLVDTIHRAVKRMLEGENGEDPVAPKVKIINLSIGDPVRCFYNSMSPLARLLDWLSYKYKILFIVSAGNIVNDIHYEGGEAKFRAKTEDEQTKIFVDYILSNRRNYRIFSPAESINNLTIGSTHEDSAIIPEADNRHNPYNIIFPSSYSPIGGGYRKSVKPDFLYTGGRLLYDFNLQHKDILQPTKYKRAPGIKTAFPDNTLNKSMYERGTSCSAALTTRNGLKCYEQLEQLIDLSRIENAYIALIIKAMLVHGCSWDQISNNIEKYLNPDLDAREIKNIKRNWLGYGVQDINKSLICSPQRATVIGFNKLNDGIAHVYELPLPPSLASKVIERKLTITLAYFTPIAIGNQKYRKAKLWFDSPTKIAKERVNVDNITVRKGTLQHEIFTGHSAEAFEDGDVIKIKVNCAKDANSFNEPIHYALIVSLEVAEGVNIPIYNEIKERILVPIAIQQQTGI